jgi:hypothetical protein
MGDAPSGGMRDNSAVGDRHLATRDASAGPVEFVCIAKHRADSTNADGYSLTIRDQLRAYCARGADENHEWVRVPPTPLDEITIGRMEDRPPDPASPRDRLTQRG